MHYDFRSIQEIIMSRTNILNSKSTFCMLALIAIGLTRCEYDQPEKLFPIPSGIQPDPVIADISPDSAVNGITLVTISGENFSLQSDQNFVYFGTTAGIIRSTASNQLIVQRPLTISGDFMIKVSVRNAFQFAETGPYNMEAGLIQIGAATENNSFTVDKAGNLYAERDNTIYKTDPSGVQSQYGTIEAASSCMRMGSGKYLYLQRRESQNFYRIPPGGGTAVRYTRILRRVSVFDFDSTGYIYSGSGGLVSNNLVGNGLFITSPDGITGNEVSGYRDLFAISAVRVFDGFVFVLADTISSIPEYKFSIIFKHEITGSGQLGERIPVLRLTDGSVYKDLTFSADGKIFLATNKTNPILVLHQDGSGESLYPGILQGPLVQLCWSDGYYLYYSLLSETEGQSALFRICMGESGAKYYGRD